MILTAVNKTMSSREIAELTGKKHHNVLRDIKVLISQLKKGGGDVSGFSKINEKVLNNRERITFELTFMATTDLVTGYDPVARQKINRRWFELEQHGNNNIDLPSRVEAIERMLVLAKEVEAIENERDLAIATKSEIGSRREATAMATASVATKKASHLEEQLDEAKSYASIKRMQQLHHGITLCWRKLKSASQDVGIEPIAVFDQNYGTVKAYHAEAWQEAYALELSV